MTLPTESTRPFKCACAEDGEPKLQNLTVGFKYDTTATSANLKEHLIKARGLTDLGNYVILKDQFTFLITFESGHVTLTGLRAFSDIRIAQRKILRILKIKFRSVTRSIKVYNLCASGKLNQTFNLNNLKSVLALNETWTFTFNTAFFPGLFTKLPNLGTITIFQNGKFTIVGSKTIATVCQICKIITAHINRYQSHILSMT
jgi:TATA-box binding protein (TBP) (component of TFIID and TFIIIB)